MGVAHKTAEESLLAHPAVIAGRGVDRRAKAPRDSRCRSFEIARIMKDQPRNMQRSMLQIVAI
jgi:hypothetical protein